MIFVASLMVIGCMSGAVIGGIQCNYLGRKKSILLDGTMLAIVYVGTGISPNLTMLMICRFIAGHVAASLICNIPAFTGEICQPEIRKLTGSFTVPAYSIGYCIMFIMGAILDWKISMYIMAGITALSTVLIMIFVPESPTWLLLKNRKDEATKSLMSLRGNEEVVNAEFKAILDNLYHILHVEEKGNNSDKNQTKHFSGLKDIFAAFHDPSFLKPFSLLVVMFCIGWELSGYPAIGFYLVELLQEGNIPMNPYWGAATIASFRAVTMLICSVLTRNLKRRLMYMSGTAVVVLGFCALGTYFLLKSETSLIDEFPILKWMPLASIFVIYTAYSFGIAPVPYMLKGEILPAQYRILGSGMVGLLANICCFTSAKMAPSLAHLLGRYGAFYWYASFSLTSGIVAFFYMPETLGLSLEDIEKIYKKGEEGVKSNVTNSRHSRSTSIISFYGPLSDIVK